MEDLKEFYKIKLFLDSNKHLEIIQKSKGLYYKNPELYI